MSVLFFVRTVTVGVMLLLFHVSSSAQYEGGVGSGYYSLFFSNSTCSLFSGGSSSGYSSLYVASTGNPCSLFTGGTNSGYNQNNYVNPEATCLLFASSASNGSGYASRSYSVDNENECVAIALAIESSPLFGEVINDSHGRLYWETYSEENNSGFEIQKSSDGKTWTTIGWIDGAGYSYATTLQYEYVDINLSSDTPYYRFKQIDFDGAASYSNVVLLNPQNLVSREEIFSLYPNPARHLGELKLKGWVKKEWNVQLIVIDLFGRTLFSATHVFNTTNNVFEFPPSSLSSGMYYLVVRAQNNTATLKVPFAIVN